MIPSAPEYDKLIIKENYRRVWGKLKGRSSLINADLRPPEAGKILECGMENREREGMIFFTINDQQLTPPKAVFPGYGT
jgi:hypothetical protein